MADLIGAEHEIAKAHVSGAIVVRKKHRRGEFTRWHVKIVRDHLHAIDARRRRCQMLGMAKEIVHDVLGGKEPMYSPPELEAKAVTRLAVAQTSSVAPS